MMINKIAEFKIVSKDRFENDCKKNNVTNFKYELITKPKRATKDSAGYDFYLNNDIVIPPKETIIIPTGLRVKIETGWFLSIYPRSGLGFKYRLSLANTVGIIDGDYYNSDNEGHIIIKLYNPNDEQIELKNQTGFCQGIFLQYGITVDDNSDKTRNGGFGSTDNN